MGRKIPAKKHRGVKDPLVQQARRLQILKGKINAPPKDPDDQPVPQSLIRLFAFQQRDKTEKKNKDKKLSFAGTRQAAVNNNPVAQLKKLPGESGRGFSLRINSAVRALHNPLEQEGYPDDVESDDTKGERMAAQRERRRRKRRGSAAPGGRPARRELTKQAKKEKTAEAAAAAAAEAEAVQYERVRFGDVAHAPPALAPPRRARPAPKPARRGLLLAAALGAAGGAAGVAAGVAAGERARLDAVAAYRALKRERRLQHARR